MTQGDQRAAGTTQRPERQQSVAQTHTHTYIHTHVPLGLHLAPCISIAHGRKRMQTHVCAYGMFADSMHVTVHGLKWMQTHMCAYSMHVCKHTPLLLTVVAGLLLSVVCCYHCPVVGATPGPQTYTGSTHALS